ncbi:MAG: PDZ domain-containing protein [Chloroflexi bacterium]|nr:PDZ domain-containing protein [Chloroflexota bacterium]
MWLLVTSLVAISGCTAVGGAPDPSGFFLGGGQSGRPPDRPRAAPQSGGDHLGTSDLRSLYEAIVDVYVDPVDPRLLIAGALRGARQASTEAGLLPMETAVLDTAVVRSTPDPDVAWAEWVQAYGAFQRKLLNRVNVSGVGQGAARGMLDALGDPNTSFLSRQEFDSQQVSDYVGVGVVLAPTGQRGSPVVREVTQGSPAEAAGLRVGDVILAIGTKSTEAMALSEAVDAIRGAAGTQLNLTVRSPNSSVSRQVEVRRGVVRATGVGAEVRNGVTYIRVRTLQEGAAGGIRAAVSQSSAATRGWILDLRGNDRGGLVEAVNVASLFLGEQTIALQEDRARRRAAIRGAGRPLSPQAPMVVLVDEGTGGASEVLAAALRDHGIAKVVGTWTAGKAAQITQFPLADGSVAQITSYRLLSPSGEQLHRVGVSPTDVVPAAIEDWVAGRDVQLERAMALLGG